MEKCVHGLPRLSDYQYLRNIRILSLTTRCQVFYFYRKKSIKNIKPIQAYVSELNIGGNVHIELISDLLVDFNRPRNKFMIWTKLHHPGRLSFTGYRIFQYGLLLKEEKTCHNWILCEKLNVILICIDNRMNPTSSYSYSWNHD